VDGNFFLAKGWGMNKKMDEKFFDRISGLLVFL
jgi:hypothetical protein